ncbi:hypothetical protein [Actinomyces oricola]
MSAMLTGLRVLPRDTTLVDGVDLELARAPPPPSPVPQVPASP